MVTVYVPQGYFRENYDLQGSDWVRQLPPEEVSAMMHSVRAAGEYGRKGGLARAKNGLRCATCKQFAKESQLTDGTHTDPSICRKSIARFKRLKAQGKI